ncbi:BrnT family toxin [Thiocapsa sp. UBA6158]|uniref:BrnT family toxin n=1 Tax=Thiocapsa sp. UBA6158 TaxID=1947692 RepID=UPI0025DFF02B|nr:BrnT family toxin [Thiocapsa sp. UBA6158]
MVDWQGITGFEWDAGNARRSENKHGLSRAEAEQVFFNLPLRLLDDRKHSGDEPRIHALGVTDAGRQLHLTFRLRDSGCRLRVISARDMPRTEGRVYERGVRRSASCTESCSAPAPTPAPIRRPH